LLGPAADVTNDDDDDDNDDGASVSRETDNVSMMTGDDALLITKKVTRHTARIRGTTVARWRRLEDKGLKVK